MSVDQIQLSCLYGCKVLLTATRPPHLTSERFCQSWKNNANSSSPIKLPCDVCGGEVVVSDDGMPASEDGNVEFENKSKPRIDSISGSVSGGTAGGTEVTVHGHAFDVEDPVVKFDGVPGTGVGVDSGTQLTVDTPAGKIKLDVVDQHTKLSHGTVTDGPFQVGEDITGGTSAATGEVTQVESGYLMVKAVSGAFEDGETITGGTSSASADLDADPTIPAFSEYETVTGQTSSSTAVVKETAPLRCDTFSGDMSDGEEILGGTSAARATLGTPGMDGAVAVTVENSNGRRGTRINHGEVTDGPFQEQETITGETSGATAVVAAVKDGFLRVVDVSGQFTAAETLTGGTSGATAAYSSIFAGQLVAAFEYTV